MSEKRIITGSKEVKKKNWKVWYEVVTEPLSQAYEKTKQEYEDTKKELEIAQMKAEIRDMKYRIKNFNNMNNFNWVIW